MQRGQVRICCGDESERKLRPELDAQLVLEEDAVVGMVTALEMRLEVNLHSTRKLGQSQINHIFFFF